MQYDEYDRDNDQRMDPTASARDSLTDVSTEKAEHPKYD